MDPALERALFLVGATAAGKSRIGLALAERLGAEIISLDSMALYRGMDIGTDKPSAEARARVRHHLIDLLEPHEEFSLGRYVQEATFAARDIQQRGRRALFVGGTALYLKGLLRGVFQGPAADWTLRARLQAEAQAHGVPYLHERLRRVDPVAADRILPNDLRRIVRALEVHEKTGRPISDLQRQFQTPRPPGSPLVIWIDRPRAFLYARINERVEAMFRAGLVDEVRGLIAAGPRALSRTAAQALGYKEVLAHLAGHLTLAQAIDLVKKRTRHFARHQLMWYRRLAECQRVELAAEIGVEEAVERIVRDFGLARDRPVAS